MKKPTRWERLKAWFAFWSPEFGIGPDEQQGTSSIELVLRERHRLRRLDLPGRDEQYARAATCYASADRVIVDHSGCDPWPYSAALDGRTRITRTAQLVRAAAFLLMEIDRLQQERPVPKVPPRTEPRYDDSTDFDGGESWNGDVLPPEPKKP